MRGYSARRVGGWGGGEVGGVGRAYPIMLRSLFSRRLCKNCIQHTKQANKENKHKYTVGHTPCLQNSEGFLPPGVRILRVKFCFGKVRTLKQKTKQTKKQTKNKQNKQTSKQN